MTLFDYDYNEFKKNFREFNMHKGLVDQTDDEGDLYKLTEKGLRLVLELYERGLAGETVEQIEAVLELDPSDDHAEYKILFAMGDMCGIFDKYDEIDAMAKALDAVETEYLYGDSNEG